MPAIPGDEPRNVPGFDPPMGLRRRSIVVTQNPADSLTPAHRTIRSSHGRTLDQLVPDFLVISLMVVVLDELQHQTAQMHSPTGMTRSRHSVLIDGATTLRVRVAVRRCCRRARHANANRPQ
jgi:hypothetical protein